MADCKGTNASGGPCEKRPELVDDDGYCVTHRPGGREHMKDIGSKGGAATTERLKMPGLDAGELPELVDMDSAMAALNVIVRSIGVKITHTDGNAMTKGVEAWVKAHSQGQTTALVTEIDKKLKDKERECNDLRAEIAKLSRKMFKAS